MREMKLKEQYKATVERCPLFLLNCQTPTQSLTCRVYRTPVTYASRTFVVAACELTVSRLLATCLDREKRSQLEQQTLTAANSKLERLLLEHKQREEELKTQWEDTKTELVRVEAQLRLGTQRRRCTKQ